jgi:hypothetical protein
MEAAERSERVAAGEAEMEVLTEDCSGRIITGETGLAHTRTVDGQLKLISSPGTARCCGRGRRGLR